MGSCSTSPPEVRRTPHPVIVTIRDKDDDIRVYLYPYFIPLLQGGGVPLKQRILQSYPYRDRRQVLFQYPASSPPRYQTTPVIMRLEV